MEDAPGLNKRDLKLISPQHSKGKLHKRVFSRSSKNISLQTSFTKIFTKSEYRGGHPLVLDVETFITNQPRSQKIISSHKLNT